MLDDSNDDLDLDNEDEVPAGSDSSETPTRSGDNKTVRQMREALKREREGRKSLEAEVEELRSQVREREEREAKATLAAAGFNDGQVEVFRKAYGDATPENIAAFEAVLGRQEAAPTIPSFEPTLPSGGDTSTKRISRTEFETLMGTNQALATQYGEKGLVDWNRK